MRCPVCSTEAADAETRCPACGVALSATTSASAEDKFPDAERRVLTVLFADIVGSTEMISELDPESALQYLTPALQEMGKAVTQFHGEVMSTMGDGLMALFGTSSGQENHALLACQAAIAMQRALDNKHVVLRIGIHSGDVITGITDELVHKQSAHGAAIHLASRLEHMAAPGSICITDTTLRLVGPFCDSIPLGMHQVRGFTKPVGISQLVGLKPPNSTSNFRRAPGTALAGRDVEMDLLSHGLEDARRGRGNAIGISAPAGTGKSRLCFEFAKLCKGQNIPVIEAQASPYEYAGYLQPFLDFLRVYFQIRADDNVSDIRHRITEKLNSLHATDVNSANILADFLGPPSTQMTTDRDAKAKHAQLLGAVRDLMRAAGRGLSVLVIEDVHWFDRGSSEFISVLLDSVAETRTLVILTYRSEFEAPWKANRHFSEIRLPELQAKDMSALLEGLVGNDPSTKSLREELAERSAGNPFFAEELVRSLLENDTIGGSVGSVVVGSFESVHLLPTTVQNSIEARINRLSREAKSLLQTGAAIGREFPFALLMAIAGRSEAELVLALDQLAVKGLMTRRVSKDGVEQVAFNHQLIQEVAYKMQLKSRRASLHRKVAASIEAFHAHRLDEYSDLVSRHLEAAGDNGPAASFAARSAIWVGTTHSRQAAEGWLRVSALLRDEPRSPTTDLLRIMAAGQIVSLGWREGMKATEAQSIAEQGLALARETSNIDAEIFLVAGYGRILAATGSADGYVEHAEKALAMTHNSLGQSALLHAILCQAYAHAGRLREAKSANDFALTNVSSIRPFYQKMLGFNIERWVRGMRARILVKNGEFEKARALATELISTEVELPDPTVQFIPHLAFVELAWLTEDAELARVHAHRLTEISQLRDNIYVGVYANVSEGMALALEGKMDSALMRLSTTVENSRETGVGLEFEPDVLATIAEIYRKSGREREAITKAKEVLALSRERGTRLAECRATITLSLTTESGKLATDERDAVAAAAMRLVELTGAQGYLRLLTFTDDVPAE